MKEELRVFFTAVMFYTRIPCPAWVGHEPEYINRSLRYFPLIGYIVGGVAAITYVLSSPALGLVAALILSLAASVLVTGAFHEDGFADVCDGFGGGWSAAQILSIMKDSRLGTYGAVGLLLLLATKLALLHEVLSATPTSWFIFSLLLICAHAQSRFMAATVVFSHPYVRDDLQSKSKPVAQQSGFTNLLWTFIFSALPLLLLCGATGRYLLLTVPLILYIVKAWMARYFTRWIGGYTGDCLGAVQQVTEVCFYGLFLLVWKYT
jgi:adenosylcobinamide-GDP ribazoletransferase